MKKDKLIEIIEQKSKELCVLYAKFIAIEEKLQWQPMKTAPKYRIGFLCYTETKQIYVAYEEDGFFYEYYSDDRIGYPVGWLVLPEIPK